MCGRSKASFTIISPPRGSSKYLGDFIFESGRGSAELCSGNLLSVRIALHYLRGLPRTEALFDEAQICRRPPSESCSSRHLT